MEFDFYFPLLVLLLAVYNLFYGAYCWVVFGLNGLLIGSIIMILGVIGGVIIRDKLRSKDA